MTSAEQFLGEASYESHPGFKFATIGDFVSGTIVGEPRPVEVKSLKVPGTTEWKLVVNLVVSKVKGVVGVKDDEGNKLPDRPAEVGETVSVWIGKGFQAQAVSDAVRAATGGVKMTEGGTLTVQWNDTKDTGKPKPAMLYKVAYVAPAPSTDVSAWGNETDPF